MGPKREPIGKKRRWQANVSVAASGPGFTPGARDVTGFGAYSKAAAELRYTIADVAYLSEEWRTPPYAAPFEFHASEYGGDYATVLDALARAKNFLIEGSLDPDFDGGSLLFAFSGHGREGDGTLWLDDNTFLSADDFVGACVDTAQAAPGRGRLRLSILLDSCYSGAFLLRTLERTLHEHADLLVADYFMAAAMPDELAWEVPVLGHGLSTFCFSVRPQAPGSMVATADGMTTTWGIAAGPEGCSLVTSGQQNPVVYDAYELRVARTPINVWDGEPHRSPLRSHEAWRADLVAARNRLRQGLAQALGANVHLGT